MKRFLLPLFFGSSVLFANPQNPNTVSGKCSFEETGKKIEITVSDSAIIDWESFSISSGETTRFFQPSKQATVLNRVTGREGSEILGMLQGNGRVYLVNPNGVVVGKEGRIDTAAFLASTHDVRNEEFLKGELLTFEGESLAEVLNLGTIETSDGPVVLVGHKVTNGGAISALEHTVSLASGHKILLDPTGDALLYICPDLKGAGVENSGSIEAWTAQLQSDGTPTRLAIGLAGAIDARSVVREGGRIFLRAQEGSIDVAASGTLKVEAKGEITVSAERDQCTIKGTLEAPGGEINILGKGIRLLDQAKMDVSHETGGGIILVGGDEGGKNPSIPNALDLFVGKEATLYADAKGFGSGGKVIFWGDRSNVFLGTVTAQGGPLGGDGGFVEVSSPGQLIMDGLAKTLAPLGKAGDLLLDPTNVCISSPGDMNWTFDSGTMEYTFTGSTMTTPCSMGEGGVTIPSSNIVMNLANGNVTIDTSAMTDQGEVGDIFVNEDIIWSAATTLTLSAENNITINGVTISNSNSTEGLAPLELNYADLILTDGTNISLNLFPSILNCTLSGTLTFAAAQSSGEVFLALGTLEGDTTIYSTADITALAFMNGPYNLSLYSSSSALVSDIGLMNPVTSFTCSASPFLFVGDGIATSGGAITLDTRSNFPANDETATILQNGSLTVAPGSFSPISINTGCIEVWSEASPPTYDISTDGDITILSGGSAYFTVPGTIESTGSNGIITLVADQFFAQPSFGFGSQVLNSGITLSTGAGGQVQLYTAVAGIASFPLVINGAPYMPGSFTTTNAYNFGTNEYLGFWYPNLPPVDPPPFLVMFKSLYVPTPSASTLVVTSIALTEPTSTPAKPEGNGQLKPSTPSPKAACSPPSISIKAL